MSVQETDQLFLSTTFIWTIKNIELYEWGVHLYSPEFTVADHPRSSFSLFLHDEDYTKNGKYFSLFINNCDGVGNYDGYAYSFMIGIMTRDGKQNCIKYDAITFENENPIGERKFIEKEMVYSERQLMIPDGNLTLFCEVTECKFPLNPIEQIELKEYSDAFVKLYESGMYSDLTIDVKEKSFKIHKAIIEARFSDFLKKLNGSVCKIENINAKTVSALLQYLYSGYLKVSDVNVHEVFSSEYKIPAHLKSLLITKPYLQHQKIKAVTRIGKKLTSFTWKIHNFKSLEPGKWLGFYLEGNFFMVFLTLSKNKNNLIISIEYSNINKKLICNIKIGRVNKSFSDSFEGDRWILPNIPLKEIFNEDINYEDIKNINDVNLDFKIDVSSMEKSSETTIELFSYEDSPLKNAENLVSLRSDLEKLYYNMTFSDVLLKTLSFDRPAHKCILSARSTTFADLLQNSTAEKEFVIDFDYDIVHWLLIYIYSNTIRFSIDREFTRKHAIDMYHAANKYKLPGLRSKCSELLKDALNADMAGEYSVAAYGGSNIQLVCSNPQDIK